MSEPARSIRNQLVEAESVYHSGQTDRAVLLFARILAGTRTNSRATKFLQRIRKKKGTGLALSQSQVNTAAGMFQRGDHENCVRLTRSLIIEAPQEPVLFNMAGMALSILGQNEEAVEYLRVAIMLRPGYTEALANLGTALLKTGNTQAAIKSLNQALQQNPDFADGQTNLGYAYFQATRYDEALGCFDRALSLQPNRIDAINGKATTLQSMMRLDEAIALFCSGLEIEPRNYELLVNSANALVANDMVSQSVDALEKALSISDHDPEVWHSLGAQRGFLGQREAAIAAYDKATGLDPKRGETWRSKSMLKKFSKGDPEIAKMEALFNAPEATADLRMHLGFALGKACEDTGNFATAFSWWKGANAGRRANSPYDPGVDRALFQMVQDVFSESHFEALDGYQDTSKAPIFVVGMMRSGSTLVEQILSAHTDATGIGEQPYFDDKGREILPHLQAGSFGWARDLTQGYVDKMGHFNPGAQRTVDKMPLNFLWVGLIKTVFPNAKFVRTEREPRDICLSIFKNYFNSEGNLYAYNLLDIGRFYLMQREMIAHWDKVLPGVIHPVRYEEITRNFESETRALLDHCDLVWQDGLEQFHKNRQVVRTASVGQVREKIYTSSIAAWKRYENEIEDLDKLLKDAGV